MKGSKVKGGAGSRNKGKLGELEVAKLLQAEGWLNAKRGQQRAGVDQPDVIGGPVDLHLEVKRTETVQLRPWLEQAKADAPGGRMPTVVHRRNGDGDWIAVVPFVALVRLLARLERLESGAVETISGQRQADR